MHEESSDQASEAEGSGSVLRERAAAAAFLRWTGQPVQDAHRRRGGEDACETAAKILDTIGRYALGLDFLRFFCPAACARLTTRG